MGPGEDGRIFVKCTDCGETYLGGITESDDADFYIRGKKQECDCGNTQFERV